jgi:hypothetical protein
MQQENQTHKSRSSIWKKFLLAAISLPFLVGIISSILKGEVMLPRIQVSSQPDSAQLMLQTIRYAARKSVTDSLANPDNFEEIAHLESEAADSSGFLYYRASVTYRAKSPSGEQVLKQTCFHFLQNGSLSKKYDCSR